MSSRKSRLSLSTDVRKEGKTPNVCRTPARKMGKKHSDTQGNDDSCEVSPSQSVDSPVIPLTQDNTFHAINGVSWKWHSPQRFQGQIRMKSADVRKSNHKPLRKHSEVSVVAPKEATGFNKFISKLNLLMEKENMEENVKHSESSSLAVDTLDENYFITDERSHREDIAKHNESDDDLFQQHCIDTLDEGCVPKAVTTETGCFDTFDDGFMDQAIEEELDDSKLDRILIEASQSMEQKLCKPSVAPPLSPEKVDSNACIPFEMNDSDMDGFLVQASLMVEEKLSDSSQDSTPHKVNHLVPKENRYGEITHRLNRTNHPTAPMRVDSEQAQPSVDPPSEGVAAVTSEITMSQQQLKALLEQKRQEALRRLQQNRLKRAMTDANAIAER